MKNILGVDPGTTHSAYVLLTPERTVKHKAVDMSNEEFLGFIYTFADSGFNTETELVIEMPEARGMPVGKDVFETIYWVGRFCEAWFGKGDGVFHRAYPRDIRSFLCGTTQAKKGNVRQALIDIYGKPGVKKAPNLNYGEDGTKEGKMKTHMWSALAVATYWYEKISYE